MFVTPRPPSVAWIVGCANFAAQYNYNSITLALLMLERAGKDVPTWATSSLSSVIFLGSIFGQLSLGYLGDAIGRNVGLALTLVFIIAGAFLSAAAWDYETEPSTSVYVAIILSRFVLGVGVGGVYPLSATAAFEDRAGKGCEIPNFKGSYLGRFPLVLADFGTSDHLSERSRSMNVVS